MSDTLTPAMMIELADQLDYCAGVSEVADRGPTPEMMWAASRALRQGAEALETLEKIRALDPDGDDFIGKLQNLIFIVHPQERLAPTREERS